MDYRFRFAPSPTGFLHIGSLRTVLFAYLAAKHYDGKLLLRIEDTDQERKVDGAVKSLIEVLDEMDIKFDEGPSKEELSKINEDWDNAPIFDQKYPPYIQTLKKERYKEVAEKLVELGAAYRCDCTPEKLEEERKEREAKGIIGGYSGFCRDRNVSKDTKHVIRLKMPKDCNLEIEDPIKGKLTWREVPLADPVIFKSDGLPTYHLAAVVDDHDMKISHVFRGDEWVATTPIHLLLYKALGWEAPKFCHLPLVLGKDKKKLSKRHGSTFVSNFLEEGYLPSALINYVALVGWNPGNDKEIFTKEELIKEFTIERINNAGGIFDYDKLLWMNGVHIRNLSINEYIERVKPFFEKANVPFDEKTFRILAKDIQERTKVLSDVPARVEFLFKDKIEKDIQSMYKKGIDAEKAKQILECAKNVLSDSKLFTNHDAQEIENTLYKAFQELGFNMGATFGVLRVATMGSTVTPPLGTCLLALTQERTLKRIEEIPQDEH